MEFKEVFYGKEAKKIKSKNNGIGGKVAGAAFWVAVGAASVILADKKQRKKISKAISEGSEDAMDFVKGLGDKAKELTAMAEDELEEKRKFIEGKIIRSKPVKKKKAVSARKRATK